MRVNLLQPREPRVYVNDLETKPEGAQPELTTWSKVSGEYRWSAARRGQIIDHTRHYPTLQSPSLEKKHPLPDAAFAAAGVAPYLPSGLEKLR